MNLSSSSQKVFVDFSPCIVEVPLIAFVHVMIAE